MQVAIIGYGKQGQSAYNYWKKGNEITICDKDESVKLPSDVKKRLGPDHLKNLGQFDLIVRSPIVHPTDIVKANSPEILQKVTSNTNEFFKVCPSKNIIGVTGTKGKGTTSTLIAKMLEAGGKTVHLGGNIGTPPLELLKNIKPEDYIVLELANFQLIDIKYSPRIAVCLMVVDEHLDWHADSQEYITAKQQMFLHQNNDDVAIYYAQNEYSQHIASVSKGQKIPYMKYPGADVVNGKILIDNQTICSAQDIKLLGKHNWQNVCASVTAVWQVTKDTEVMKKVISSFEGLEHRLEFVREVDGVKYFDDSFGTTPETAIVAMQAFEQPKVVILGGSDKGASYDDLAKTVAESGVKSVVVIGDIASKINVALEKVDFRNVVDGGQTMTEIVANAKKQAKTGDIVLLSTGSASFGLFKNYKDRGEQFVKVVQELS